VVLELLASDRYLQKGMGLIALSGRRPAEIFLSATFSLPREKLPYPALLLDGQLETRQAPGTSFDPYLAPIFGEFHEQKVLGTVRARYADLEFGRRMPRNKPMRKPCALSEKAEETGALELDLSG
jgi:Telomere resolvase